MIRKTKLLICLLLAGTMTVGMTPVRSAAEELHTGAGNAQTGLTDENSQRLEETTVMDQSGNITVVDGEEGSLFENEEDVTNELQGTDESKGADEIELLDEIFNYGAPVPAAGARIAEPLVVNFNTKGNATTSYTDEARGSAGYTNGAYGADAAYLGTSGTKIRFMLSGVVGYVESSEVELVPYSSVSDAVSYYTVSGGNLTHYIAQNMSKNMYSSLNNGPAPSCLSEGGRYYSYDGHYFYSDYAVMQSDYAAGTRANALNPAAPFYNYYQYLPLRTPTGYSADALNRMISEKVQPASKLKGIGETLITYQNQYGVNALLALSIAANESGWGMSNICQTKNNLFGLNAVDTSPGTSANTYASVDECIRQFMSGYMSSGYLDPTDWRYYGGFLGNKGSGINVKYASDPYWGEKAANLAWNLDLSGGSIDRQSYTIGIKGTTPGDYTSVNVRKEPNVTSKIFYQTKKQPDYAVFIRATAPENGFYKIQSDAVLSGDRAGVSSGSEYQFQNMYAYISSDYITIVNQGNTLIPEQTDDIGAPNEEESPEIILTPEEGTDTDADSQPSDTDVTDTEAPQDAEPTPEVKPETAPQPTPEPEVSPEPTPEAKPETAPEVKPEPAPEAKPETAPQPTPEVKPEPTPEVKPQSAPQSAPEPVVSPEPAPEVKPEAAPQPTQKPETVVQPEVLQAPAQGVKLETESQPNLESGAETEPQPTPEQETVTNQKESTAPESGQAEQDAAPDTDASKESIEITPNEKRDTDMPELEFSDGAKDEKTSDGATDEDTAEKAEESEHEKTDSQQKAPKTGDSAQLALWAALLLLSGSAAVYTSKRKSK